MLILIRTNINLVFIYYILYIVIVDRLLLRIPLNILQDKLNYFICIQYTMNTMYAIPCIILYYPGTRGSITRVSNINRNIGTGYTRV